MSNKQSNFPNAVQPAINQEQMAEMVANMEELRRLPKVNFNDPDMLGDRISYFFDWCAEKGLRPSVELMALALGTTRQNLWRMQIAGGTKGEQIENAKQLLAALLEQWSLQGKVNPTTAIFLQKNFYGYSDAFQLEAVQSTNSNLERLPTVEEVRKRIPQIADSEETYIDLGDLLDD